MILSFVTNKLSKVVKLTHVCKAWNFKRLSKHVQKANISSQNAFRVLPLIEHENLRCLRVLFNAQLCLCGKLAQYFHLKDEISGANFFIQHATNLQHLVLENASFVDLTPLVNCVKLKLIDCDHINVPKYLQKLLLNDSKCNFISSHLPNLHTQTIGENACDVEEFDYVLDFLALTDIHIFNSTIQYLGILESFDYICSLTLSNSHTKCHYHNFKEIVGLSTLKIDLSTVATNELIHFDLLFLIILN